MDFRLFNSSNHEILRQAFSLGSKPEKRTLTKRLLASTLTCRHKKKNPHWLRALSEYSVRLPL